MAVTITDKASIKLLFSQMSKVFFTSTPNQVTPDSAFIELPILEDSVTFKTGEAQLTKVKLIGGEVWDVIAKAGDDDMSLQIGSVNDTITSMFIDKVSGATVSTAVSFNGVSYTGQGYSTAVKRVTGGFWMTNSDATAAIWLPNVECYSSLMMDNNKPSYINVKFSALSDTKGAAIYVMTKQQA